MEKEAEAEVLAVMEDLNVVGMRTGMRSYRSRQYTSRQRSHCHSPTRGHCHR